MVTPTQTVMLDQPPKSGQVPQPDINSTIMTNNQTMITLVSPVFLPVKSNQSILILVVLAALLIAIVLSDLPGLSPHDQSRPPEVRDPVRVAPSIPYNVSHQQPD